VGPGVSRLTPRRRDELDPAGQALWDLVVGPAAGRLVGADGALAGPFNAWVQAPALGRAAVELGQALWTETSLPAPLVEVAIVTVAAHWQVEYEWWAHARRAQRHGVDEVVLEAIAAGTPPPADHPDERLVHAAVSDLLATGRLGPAAFAATVDRFGEVGAVELVTLVGYYAMVSFTLSAFDVPLPPGVAARWPRDTTSVGPGSARPGAPGDGTGR
jgi:4-carboxymuconolactone decarboxylase